ncbi:MAG: hypothetical protein U9P80_06520 [Thermodesulfobacteriota bacterium]|nr:hypothetical protein [Thermodesulfobacteriota bacterium]
MPPRSSQVKDKGQKLHLRDWRPETGDRRLEAGGWRLETGDWRPAH